MGASGWDYLVPFDTDVATTLAVLHDELFRAEYADDYATLEELWADEEFMGEAGTHTLLDTYRLLTTTAQPVPLHGEDYNTLRPLAPERVLHHFGTERPSLLQYQEQREADRRADEHRTYPPVADTPVTLDDEATMRWAGLYLLLYENDRPAHVAFWGSSGD